MTNYGFRDMTYDIDAIIHASSSMKLMAGRKYKNDLSDIIGILYEEQDSRDFLYEIMNTNSLQTLYTFHRTNEISTKESLIDFEQNYPNVVTTDNVNDIIKQLKARL